MTDKMKALVQEARQAVLTMDYERAYQGGLVGRLADALSPLPDEQLDEIEKTLDAFDIASARSGAEAAIAARDLLAEVRRLRALSSHPDEEADQAIARLIELAKDRIETIDGEWGCSHSFDEAVAGDCSRMRDDAAEVVALVAALSAHPAEETEGGVRAARIQWGGRK